MVNLFVTQHITASFFHYWGKKEQLTSLIKKNFNTKSWNTVWEKTRTIWNLKQQIWNASTTGKYLTSKNIL